MSLRTGTNAHEIRKQLKARPRSSHKGDFGRVFILAGSKGLAGAATLAGMGALRSGAGLVTVGVPETIYPIAARRHAELMVKPFPATREGTFAFRAAPAIEKFMKGQDVFAIGPGLSQNSETQKLARHLISKNLLPAVVDADGLNALKGNLTVLKKARGRIILTPHPGEFIRLFGGKLTASDKIRKKRATEAARSTSAVVVLKGHHTVVASPGGKVFVNPTGNPGMASGGTGDVLTGVIAALLGQGLLPFDAARFGVYLHGLAGDLAAKETGEISLVAADLFNFLPVAFKKTLK